MAVRSIDLENSMTIRSLLASSSVAALLAGLALGVSAQTQAPAADPAAGQDKAVVEGAFARADADADGKLSKDEAAKLPAIGTKFDELDKDKDGSLTSEEFSSGYVAK
jgi:hypothetical protein